MTSDNHSDWDASLEIAALVAMIAYIASPAFAFAPVVASCMQEVQHLMKPLHGIQQAVTCFTGQVHRSFILCSEVSERSEWSLSLALPQSRIDPFWWHTKVDGVSKAKELIAVRWHGPS